jgi:hypothetical protein
MGVIDKLTNQITYKINELVTDPKAEEIAKQQEREKAIAQKQDDDKKQKDEITNKKIIDEKKVKETDWDIIKSTMINTLVIGLGIFMLLLFGSIVCNLAIHRHIAVRLLYFIYGIGIGGIIIFISLINPFFILLGIIINAILYKTNKLPHWYAFIPLTTSPATSAFGKILKAPFYWDPESSLHKSSYLDALNTYKTFLKDQLIGGK